METFCYIIIASIINRQKIPRTKITVDGNSKTISFRIIPRSTKMAQGEKRLERKRKSRTYKKGCLFIRETTSSDKKLLNLTHFYVGEKKTGGEKLLRTRRPNVRPLIKNRRRREQKNNK